MEKKITYSFEIRKKTVKLIKQIEKLEKCIDMLNCITDKTVKLSAELEMQKDIDMKTKQLISMGFESLPIAIKIEKYFTYLEYCNSLVSNYWLTCDNENAYPPVVVHSSTSGNITSDDFFDLIQDESPLEMEEKFHVQNSVSLWEEVKNHFYNQMRPFVNPTVEFLSKYIIFDEDNDFETLIKLSK